MQIASACKIPGGLSLYKENITCSSRLTHVRELIEGPAKSAKCQKTVQSPIKNYLEHVKVHVDAKEERHPRCARGKYYMSWQCTIFSMDSRELIEGAAESAKCQMHFAISLIDEFQSFTLPLFSSRGDWLSKKQNYTEPRLLPIDWSVQIKKNNFEHVRVKRTCGCGCHHSRGISAVFRYKRDKTVKPKMLTFRFMPLLLTGS